MSDSGPGRGRHPPPLVPLMLAAATLIAGPAEARVLDKVRVSRSGPEATIELEFMCALHYVGHRLAGAGDSLVVDVAPGDDCLLALRNTLNDMRRPVTGRLAGLREIEFEHEGSGKATVTLRFERPVSLEVSQSVNRHMLTVVVDTRVAVASRPAPEPEPEVIAEEAPVTAPPARASRRVERPPSGQAQRFVIRAAVVEDLGDLDPEVLDLDASRVAYVNRVSVGERSWTELRIGFFDEETEAVRALGAIEDVFPSAWITVADAAEQARAHANPVDPASLTDGAGRPPAQAATARDSGEPLAAEAQTTMFAEARAAMLRGEYATGIDLYTQLVQTPDGVRQREARELLGVALEKSDQLDRARAEYRAYLSDYSTGPDVGRVRQRLAAISAPDRPGPASQPAGGTASGIASGIASGWNLAGGVSQFYLRGVNLGTGNRPDVVAQSALLSQAQLIARRRGQRFDIEARGNLGLLYDFDDESNALQAYVSTAFVDVVDTQTDTQARLGRQHLPRAGVLARFDGVHLGRRLRPNLRINVTAGLPVDSPRFRATGDSHFYGASVDLDNVAEAWNFSAFAIRQTVDGLLDRQAVGGEARFQTRRLNVVGLVDYDASFNILNTGLLTAVWQAHDRLTLHGRWRGGVAPFLSTRNAVIGQPVNTVRELSATYSEGQIRRLARNRTAEEQAGALGLAAVLTPRLQLNADFSYLEYGSTVASGGVAAYPGTGPQYTWSANLIGSGFVKEASTFIAGYRHDERRRIDDDTAWLDLRFPLGDRLRLQTRLEVSRRVANQDPAGDVVQWLGRPVLRLWYSGRRGYRLEIEVGGQWSDQEFPLPLAPPGIVDTIEQSDYYLQLGYILDF